LKRFIKLLALLLSMALFLGGCGSKTVTPELQQPENDGNFAPETTAVANSGLLQAIDMQTTQAEPPVPVVTESPVLQDYAAQIAQNPVFSATQEPAPTDVPGPTDAPATMAVQTNASITGYSEIAGTGLGFKYSHPVNWINQPGRYSICYTEPVTSSKDYPARVVVTIKKLAHKCDAEKAQKQLVSYLELLMTEYDEKTFEVGTLDNETRFLGKKGLSTTYLAYDGDQEVKGYVMLAYSTYYVVCYHFVCAYDDYDSFESAIYYMRDSVQIEEQ